MRVPLMVSGLINKNGNMYDQETIVDFQTDKPLLDRFMKEGKIKSINGGRTYE